MTDTIPEAITTQKRRFSVVWLIPLLALALGGWLTFKYLQEKGIVIQIEFNSAEGLAAGKTKIRYKDVEIGLVDEIRFGRELANVIVTATINRDMARHLGKGTRFWVVRARVAAGEITGLSTLLGGAYINMDPETGTSGKIRSFKGLDKPPVLFTEDQGNEYLLRSTELHALNPGAPVYYRQLKVGEVVSYKLAEAGDEFEIKIFIHDPYNRYIHERTLFWNASGIDITLGADGFEMQTESIVSMLLGGIAFDNLQDETGAAAKSGAGYTLYKNQEMAANSAYARAEQKFRLYFDGSARGLNSGAPVTLRGITVGYVTEVHLQYDLKKQEFQIPVTIEFEPDRFSIIGDNTDTDMVPTTEDLVRRGLRAQLQSGNILTGQMLIDLDIYPEAEKEEARWEGDYLVLPTIPTTIDSLVASLSGFLERISRVPLEDIGINLNSVLENLDTTIKGVDSLVRSSDVSDTLGNVRLASEQLAATLKEIEGVAASFSQDSDAYQALLRTMHELSGASRSLRQMAEYLERHPEALLKGKPR